MQQRRYFAVIPFISTMATAMQTGVEAYYVPRNTFVPQTTAKSLDLDSLPEIKGARARRVPAGAKFACKPLIAVGFLVVAAAAVAIAVPFLLVPQQHQRQRLALPLPRQHQQHQQQVQRLLQQQLQQLLQQQVQRLLQQQPQHQRQALRQHQRQALRQHPQQRQQQPALPAHQQHRRPQHQRQQLEQLQQLRPPPQQQQVQQRQQLGHILQRQLLVVALQQLVTCATTTTLVASCQSYEVSWNNRCYYLDGSTGVCASGYTLGTNAVLTCIATQFVGKTYRSVTSSNCCIWTADTYECYGMSSNCNSAGTFSAGPVVNGAGCANAQNHMSGQLTFCGKV
ncbi:unnamed protein product [Rotaria socialis]|uniref:Uncharacterized protein n=1 Tax=Rotaria socialis TaxID=392032 RepID=A0A817TQB8_9BILA|nr:unnamed protein product [Rotaria socialis]